LQIWRIEEFAIVPWPKELHGQFYDGDSYIVLHTHKISNALLYDLYFWIGEKSSQDEYGAAACWTVRIDDQLGGKATQHREVQDYESQDFLALFSPGIQILNGGVDSAFNKVDRDAHRVRLLKVKGTKNIRVTEVLAESLSLNSGDVFILDTKDVIFLWIGKSSSFFERRKGNEIATSIKNSRGAKPQITTVDEGDDNATFWENLGGKGPILTAEEGGKDLDSEKDVTGEKKLFLLSDASGTLQFKQVGQNNITRATFNTNDVFIFDSGFEIFVWVGKGASAQERKSSFPQAQQYLQTSGKPAYLPITKLQEGTQHPTFDALLK